MCAVLSQIESEILDRRNFKKNAAQKVMSQFTPERKKECRFFPSKNDGSCAEKIAKNVGVYAPGRALSENTTDRTARVPGFAGIQERLSEHGIARAPDDMSERCAGPVCQGGVT